MKKTIAVLPGDGVGPEVIEEAIKILKNIAKVFGHEFMFEYGLIGACAIEKNGNPLPDETLVSCKKSDAVLFGAIGHPKYDLDPKAIIRPEQGLLQLRKKLGLYANLRPLKIFPELVNSSPLKREKVFCVDLIVVRELTGGIYFGTPQKRINKGNTAIDTCIYSRKEIIRIAKVAFELAIKRRKKVTSVDKANVLETSRLWRETVSDVSNQYPTIELHHMFVDNAAMQLIKNPSQFDVILTENMFGDILTDESSVLAGSIGLLPSASIGEKNALYEPIHGSYHKNAGKNIANPIATILSAAMMLRFSFKMEIEARTIGNAVQQVIKRGFRTADIADQNTQKEKILGTKEMGERITGLIKPL
ncbi:3-isopropylmalate dehydrogenase [Candidatus Gottesmanbacteria bacterium RIFCSPLOWO2_01_FULL_39_12b]|uniref:3-isopropylmalate dehydrogenase n=1 Tax=Candidatus Gottesmanbacteria bacterium RIFCSPLOWO2_01_FULL_39_12b TaxID=1798388 RepID=A0A1F6APJ8_9BACT|nr:MAG: 3-isopropylmalate dehydrogenase [Candidatus Gottesmanbacteria bacterium RIFCSPLOWO2_01_FULL_39_12b]